MMRKHLRLCGFLLASQLPTLIHAEEQSVQWQRVQHSDYDHGILHSPDKNNDDPDATSFFGSAVALLGSTLVVGDPGATVGSMLGAGAIYVYEKEEETNAWQLQTKLVDPVPRFHGHFGSLLGISDDTIAIGSSLQDDPRFQSDQTGATVAGADDINTVDLGPVLRVEASRSNKRENPMVRELQLSSKGLRRLDKSEQSIINSSCIASSNVCQSNSAGLFYQICRDGVENQCVRAFRLLIFGNINGYCGCCKGTALENGICVPASMTPSLEPSDIPSQVPTLQPSLMPSLAPSDIASSVPTQPSSLRPSTNPTTGPSLGPIRVASMTPSLEASSLVPSLDFSDIPSLVPTPDASMGPSTLPTAGPSSGPTRMASMAPSLATSHIPSPVPTLQTSMVPSTIPTVELSMGPTRAASVVPSLTPSHIPSMEPTLSVAPSSAPSESFKCDDCFFPISSSRLRSTEMPVNTPRRLRYKTAAASEVVDGAKVSIFRKVESTTAVDTAAAWSLSQTVPSPVHVGKNLGVALSGSVLAIASNDDRSSDSLITMYRREASNTMFTETQSLKVENASAEKNERRFVAISLDQDLLLVGIRTSASSLPSGSLYVFVIDDFGLFVEHRYLPWSVGTLRPTSVLSNTLVSLCASSSLRDIDTEDAVMWTTKGTFDELESLSTYDDMAVIVAGSREHAMFWVSLVRERNDRLIGVPFLPSDNSKPVSLFRSGAGNDVAVGTSQGEVHVFRSCDETSTKHN